MEWLILKKNLSNTNERSYELLKMKGQIEQNKWKDLWAFKNERTYWAKQIERLLYGAINFERINWAKQMKGLWSF